jgi:hypothetical protein
MGGGSRSDNNGRRRWSGQHKGEHRELRGGRGVTVLVARKIMIFWVVFVLGLRHREIVALTLCFPGDRIIVSGKIIMVWD